MAESIKTHEMYDRLVETFKSESNVQHETDAKHRFGHGALKVNGKIFAMLDSRSRFVVKLPRRRVDLLVSIGAGERFDPGHGRLMKEWLVVSSNSLEDWLTLARDAMVFVGTQSKA